MIHTGKTQITAAPTDDEVNFGEPAFFTCSALTDAQETVRLRYIWLKDGQEIDEDDPRVSLQGNMKYGFKLICAGLMPFCVSSHHNALHWNSYITLHCTSLHNIALHGIALHNIMLHYTKFDCVLNTACTWLRIVVRGQDD